MFADPDGHTWEVAYIEALALHDDGTVALAVMTWDELRAYCLSLPGATETFPFEPAVSVFKAANGKMFAITTERAGADRYQREVRAGDRRGLRAQYASIVPGYHLNKRHWITITLEGDVPDERVRELVLDSYELVTG